MKIKGKFLAIAVPVLIIGVVALVFYSRSPVLIVDDEPFVSLYGKNRVTSKKILTSLALKRRVKQVIVANDAGPDILVFVVEEASSRPYCVIFPNRYAEGARRYHEQFPEIPTVLLSGRPDPGRRRAESEAESDEKMTFFEFASYSELDFYRAGLCAALLCESNTGIIPVIINNEVQSQVKNGFIRGLKEQGVELDAVFARSSSELGNRTEFTVAVLAGSGAESLGTETESRVILFSWLNPELTSRDTVVIFDDSPWAQAGAAVKMAMENQKTGEIPSNTLIFSSKIADNRVLRGMKKAIRAVL